MEKGPPTSLILGLEEPIRKLDAVIQELPMPKDDYVGFLLPKMLGCLYVLDNARDFTQLTISDIVLIYQNTLSEQQLSQLEQALTTFAMDLVNTLVDLGAYANGNTFDYVFVDFVDRTSARFEYDGAMCLAGYDEEEDKLTRELDDV